ncbi:MAG: TatD family hydrolase [Epsilonproteobacteria bacterium]|nr:hydrolase TatD [Campylobacterota bacterium]NPA57271.1 TatD family hydrolase [Campylobacterota bacterium]
MIIDTHTHLDHRFFREDLEDVLQRAQEAGVRCAIIPGADPRDLPRAIELAERYRGIYFAVGLHPYDLERFDRGLFASLNHRKCVAVGECGLDYYRLPKDPEERERVKERQKELFIEQIGVAREWGKPLIVHIREANRDAKEILEEYSGPEGGVLHCYNASPILLDLAERNFYFGIGGVITFKNARKLVEILPKIPLDRIVIETDAPYLTPHPFRGKRNEPAYTPLIAQKIAEILGMSVEEVCTITTENAQRLFSLACQSVSLI